MAENDRLLPLIPLSILTKNSLVTSQALQKAKSTLDAAKASTKSTSTEALRHLYENERIERTRLEALNEQIQSVQSVTAFKWDADTIARQIAIIDSQLFKQLQLDNNLAFSDSRDNQLLYFTDFHRYLTSNFAHQLIYWAEVSRSTDARNVDPPIQHRDSLISHLVRVAYLLLHVYRDFSGCFAIMKALSSREVRRIRRLWTQCPSRSKDLYKELVVLLSPANEYRSYRDTLVLKLNHFSSDPRSKEGMMIAVPWLYPYLNQIRYIAREYTAGGQDRTLEDKSQRILSAPGAKKLSEVMAILRKCQSNSSSEWEDVGARTMVKSVALNGLRKIIDPPLDVAALAPGNLGVYHWLVSRVYLTKQQLIEESMEVEPLAPGEELSCDNVEVNEDRSDLSPELGAPSETINTVSSPIPQPEQIDDPHSQPPSDISVPDESRLETSEDDSNNPPTPKLVLPSIESITNDDNGRLSSELDQVHEDTAPLNAADVQVIENEPTSHTPQFSDPLRIDSPALPSEPVENPEPEVKKVDVDSSKGTQQETNGHKEMSKDTLAPSKPAEHKVDTRRSRLSPSAPAFVPKTVTMSPIPEPIASNETASPSSSTTFEEELDTIPKESTNEAPANAAAEPSEEEDDEVWRGYQPSYQGTPSNNQGEDSVSDEWNGYPTPKSGEDDGDDEWTGYPGATNKNAHEARRQSSRSSTSEDWKGYQAHKTEDAWRVESRQQASEHDWQGYTLETLDEDELDSSTMMNGEFGKKQRERESFTNYDPLESFKSQIHIPETSGSKPKFHEAGTFGRAGSRRLKNNHTTHPSAKNVL
ncbi:hypothetical protein Unana1_05927 [Umbelopsis nana]